MPEETFEGFIERERTRLRSEREAIFNQQQQLEDKLTAINRELSAIDAYEAAKTGKAVTRTTRPTRTRTGSKREGILQAIKSAGGGLTRGELLERLGLKGDKAGEMSVSNALTALTKTSAIVRRDGRYRAP